MTIAKIIARLLSRPMRHTADGPLHQLICTLNDSFEHIYSVQRNPSLRYSDGRPVRSITIKMSGWIWTIERSTRGNYSYMKAKYNVTSQFQPLAYLSLQEMEKLKGAIEVEAIYLS